MQDDREICTRRSRTSTRSTRRSDGCSRWRTCCRARSPQHLHRWVQGGPYARLFDNVEDTLTFQRVQCFDFEGLEQYPAGARAAAVLRPASGERRRFRTADGGAAQALRARRGVALRRGPHGEGVHHRGAEDLAQAQRRDAPRDAEQRGLSRPRTSCAPSSRAVRRSSSSRIPAWTSSAAAQLFHLNDTEADAASRRCGRASRSLLKRPDRREGAQPPRRPAVVLDLHQHAAGQRAAPGRGSAASGRVRRSTSSLLVRSTPCVDDFWCASLLLACAVGARGADRARGHATRHVPVVPRATPSCGSRR